MPGPFVGSVSGTCTVMPAALEPSAADGLPSVDSWSEKDQRIIVSQPAAGFLYDLILRAKIDAHPDDVYAVLKDPRSHEIFRGIKETLSRTTLEDDGKGRRKLRIGHRAVTKFLWISVTFDTELFVWEDDIERTIKFTNARSDGFMRKFDGTWHVQPFTQHTLDSIYRPQQQPRQQPQTDKGWLSPAGALSALQQRVHSSSKQPDVNALVTLEQALSPKARPPGPVAHLVRALCARVLQNMMADLRKEVHRRQALVEGGCACGRKNCEHCSNRAGKKRSTPSLPVASITSSGISSSSRRNWHDWPGSRSSSGQSAGDFCSGVQQLLATAVPLDITIKL